ncbi:DUF922 domain-containing protein [Allorhizobium sp. BGMRC 0089]|uniref:DUF922 domain-containing Zn-dependent protease n=1 Tax=Allorhizobium sonneratiae TaxID=2934936 RepID=UPI0020335144|nr:DUF922 domain-containing protein [Allorhizobium sonneratiae]MCM2292799.1 DUF922 domain-containing protein [Allorhizobium sonneratiae]
MVSRHLSRALLPLIALYVLSGSANAQTIVHKSMHYFRIGGHTAEELDRELESKGPHTSNSAGRHPGAARIRFGGTLTYVRTPDSCKIGRSRVTVSIEIIIPRWINRRHASRNLALVWDTIYYDIRRHEARHAEIAVQHARDLDRRLMALSSYPNCQALQKKIVAVTDKVSEEQDEDQLRFDRIEAINYDARLMRLLKYRFQQLYGVSG